MVVVEQALSIEVIFTHQSTWFSQAYVNILLKIQYQPLLTQSFINIHLEQDESFKINFPVAFI